MILSLLILTLICAILYRLGGIGKPFKSWMRDWLIPPLIYAWLFYYRHPDAWYGWLMILPAIGLTGAALTTYLDSIFGYDNFWAAGFLVGLAAFPLYWTGIAWWLILIRAVLLGVTWGVWCKLFSNDWVEECGRGAFIALTLPLLLC
ncbi:MAG: hypothetical protein WC926_04965 [Candidatus Paceibacterota bacterium]|jgi:hypothetical protein